MLGLVTHKNERDPTNNKGACVNKSLNINFSDGLGKLNLFTVVESSRNSNSFKPLCLSFLHAIMRKTQSKMEALV